MAALLRRLSGLGLPVSPAVRPALTKPAQHRFLSAPSQVRCNPQGAGTAFQHDPVDGVPSMVTAVPGPNTVKNTAELTQIMDAQNIPFFVDLEKSSGNYVTDVDGNRLLDLFCQISSLPIGYNHPDLIAVAKSQESVLNIVNRTALARHPPGGYAAEVKETLMSVAPKGMTEVMPMMCGSCANENAFKCVFMWYMNKTRGGAGFTVEEETSCMVNMPPGASNLSILSFRGCFHGRTLGALSATRSKALHKIDIPAFDWPVAPFPQLKYPLDKFAAENRAEEQRCLAETKSLMAEWSDKGMAVAGVITEPIQSEGGDHHASTEFFTELRKITREAGAAFVVDEVQTGVGTTGHMWAHEKWNLADPPDIVTFAKKMQIAGYYLKSEFRPDKANRVMNTWYGDVARMVIAKEMLRVVKRDDLVTKAAETGAILQAGLKELEARYPSIVSKARGEGTFCAIDCSSAKVQGKLISELQQVGVHTGGCGDLSIRFRPSLLLTPQHVHLAMAKFHEVLSRM